MGRNRRKGTTAREREKHERELTDMRRRKGLRTTPTDKTPEDGSLFSEEREVIGELPPVKLGTQVFCPARGGHYTSAEEMRGAVCYFHKRHAETPPAERRAGVVLPPRFWGRP